jgi:Uncharacterized protein conserved in bacteria (DUF2188)
MSEGDVHTLPHKGGWANNVEGSRRVANTAVKKAEAQAKGREMAIKRKVEHFVHNKDGTIGQRNSYGADSRRRKGSWEPHAGEPERDDGGVPTAEGGLCPDA